MSCSRAPPPLELILNNDPNGFDPNAGNVVTFNLGNPSQELRLTPATTFINSGVHIEPPACNSSDSGCGAGSYGGIYDSTKSTTYAAAAFANWNGSHVAGQTTSTSTYFNELVKFTDQSLSGVPLVTLDKTLDIPNVFGIGRNSTIVSQAYNSGLTTSNSWSLYAGTTTKPGSLILGGYSNNFVNGNLSGRSSDPSCPICFQVSSITFDTPIGSTAVLKAGQGSFMATFEPFTNWLAFPGSVYDDWVKLTNGTIGQQDFTTYNNDSVPQGNLTISLASGIKVTIAHDDLFTSGTINGNGLAFTPKSGNQIAKIKKIPGNIGVLGFPYLSHVYMIYDNDRQTLNVSNAAIGATSNGQITKICPPSTATSPDTGSNTVSATPSNSAVPSERNYTGAIAGGVVGFIALLVAVVAIVFLILRHRRRQSRFRPTSGLSNIPLEKDSRNVFPTSLFTKPSQDHSAYREVTSEPIEMHHRHKVEMPTEFPAYELPTSSMREPTDIAYERYELSSEPADSIATARSWDETTLTTKSGLRSPSTLQSAIMPRWDRK